MLVGAWVAMQVEDRQEARCMQIHLVNPSTFPSFCSLLRVCLSLEIYREHTVLRDTACHGSSANFTAEGYAMQFAIS